MGASTGFEALKLYSGVFLNCPNTKCKKLVIVDDEHLEAGMLYCKECQHTVEICGDKKAADAYKAKVSSNAASSKSRSKFEPMQEQDLIVNKYSSSIWGMFGLDVEKYERKKSEKQERQKVAKMKKKEIQDEFALAA